MRRADDASRASRRRVRCPEVWPGGTLDSILESSRKTVALSFFRRRKGLRNFVRFRLVSLRKVNEAADARFNARAYAALRA